MLVRYNRLNAVVNRLRRREMTLKLKTRRLSQLKPQFKPQTQLKSVHDLTVQQWSVPEVVRSRHGMPIHLFKSPTRLALFHEAAYKAASTCSVDLERAYEWMSKIAFFRYPRDNAHIEILSRIEPSSLAEQAIIKVYHDGDRSATVVHPEVLNGRSNLSPNVEYLKRFTHTIMRSNDELTYDQADAIYRESVGRAFRLHVNSQTTFASVVRSMDKIQLLSNTMSNHSSPRKKGDFTNKGGFYTTFCASQAGATMLQQNDVFQPEQYEQSEETIVQFQLERALQRVHRFQPNQYAMWATYVTACRRDDMATALTIVPHGSADWIEGPFLVNPKCVQEVNVPSFNSVNSCRSINYMNSALNAKPMIRPVAIGHQLVAISQTAVDLLNDLIKRNRYRIITSNTIATFGPPKA